MLEISRAVGDGRVSAMDLSVSTSNELFGPIASAGATVLPVRTFERGWESVVRADRLLALRRELAEFLRRRGTRAMVTMMPHVWSPLVTPGVKALGVRTVSIVHDATPHPGDPTARLNRWLMRDQALADRIVTLSSHVTESLVAAGMPAAKITTLFHPIVGTDGTGVRVERGVGELPRLLFLGRILPYKGLGLAVDALNRLAAAGIRFPLTVAGEGDLTALAPGLSALGAAVHNHWLDEGEIARLCATHDAMLLPYVEASQSGVAGLALSAHLPMIATPVGGLREQVEDGVTGLVAERADPDAFAEALRRLALEADLLDRLRTGVALTAEPLGMPAFLKRLEDVALG
jgi:glycosyltransferase involved in cell wall biosynthesis